MWFITIQIKMDLLMVIVCSSKWSMLFKLFIIAVSQIVKTWIVIGTQSRLLLRSLRFQAIAQFQHRSIASCNTSAIGTTRTLMLHKLCPVFFLSDKSAPLVVDVLAHLRPDELLYPFPPLSLISPTLISERENTACHWLKLHHCGRPNSGRRK